jgi:hypothetical protein
VYIRASQSLDPILSQSSPQFDTYFPHLHLSSHLRVYVVHSLWFLRPKCVFLISKCVLLDLSMSYSLMSHTGSCSSSSTVRASREVHWEWGGHEQLRFTPSQNMRPPLIHYSYTQCTALPEYNVFGIETDGMRCKMTPSPAHTSQRNSLGARTVVRG